MKSGEELYDVSQVRVDDEQSEVEQNHYLAPETGSTHEIPGEPAAGTAKLRVIPMLAFVVVGMILGQYFISPQILPRSVHALQQFRGAAIGGLLGVLLYAMIEHFFAREG